jgi:4-hydroxybenzoate polyprenyltransferase
MRPLIEFARTIRLSHTLFALPFALAAALVAEPPWPRPAALALLAACMVFARTAAMGMNRVADAAFDARNPRTADRAIPAGRLARRTALVLALASAAAFVAAAWGFYLERGNAWPGLLAPLFAAVLLGYSFAKRVTMLSHAVLGLALGLAPVGAWVALRGRLDAVPVFMGAAVLCWTAGFDILYAFQDIDVDRRDGLHSVPARLGPRAARWIALVLHALTVLLLVATVMADNAAGGDRVLGNGATLAAEFIAIVLGAQHWRARKADAATIARGFFPLNAFVSILWLAGVAADVGIATGLLPWGP